MASSNRSVPLQFLTGAALIIAACAASSAGRAEEHPTFGGGVLTIPRIDTRDQVGTYQDATLIWNTEENRWHLAEAQTLGGGALGKPLIETVDVVKTKETPASVYLRVVGHLGCGPESLPRLQQRRSGTHFEILITRRQSSPPGAYACVAMLSLFKLTVPLDVYGLSAGTYTFAVNGVTGGFKLESDNKFSDDCGHTERGEPSCGLIP